MTEAYKNLDIGKEPHHPGDNSDFVGKVFLRCNAREVLERCGKLTQDLLQQAYGAQRLVPNIELEGDLEATFPYILSHLEYIIGELLRNAIDAVSTHFANSSKPLPPIKILVCEAPQHVIFRISDQGGGIPRDVLPHLWSFSKGPRRQSRLQNLNKVPRLEGSFVEVAHKASLESSNSAQAQNPLGSLTSRPPSLKLGMGLPMSRVYAEYWAGSLEVHSLEGYGTDQFLHISKLGNKNEQLSTRASMDRL